MKEWNFQSVRHEAKDIVMEGHVLVVMCGKSPEVCLNTSRRTGCAGDFDSRYI